MESSRYGTIMSMPVPLTLSTMAIPSLEPIPGSAAPTPSLHEMDAVPTPPPLAQDQSHQYSHHRSPQPDGDSLHTAPSDYMTPPEDYASRRSSISLQPIPGSYFPSSPGQSSSSVQHHHFSPSPSGSSTPADRPRPTPIAIPSGTTDDPLFSAYPDQGQGPSRSNSKGKGRSFTFPLKPAFSLSHPPQRKRGGSAGETSTGTNTPVSATGSTFDLGPPLPKPTGRRRASTFSGSPPDPTPVVPEPRRHSLRVPKLHGNGSRSFKSFGRRRVSAPAEREIDPDYDDSDNPSWPSMPSEEARRFDRNPQLPYSYQRPADSAYTLESVSTIATVRPLSASPAITPRRSSLSPTGPGPAHLPQTRSIVLGLSNVPAENDPPVEVVLPDDLTMPHGPPPRRSSLDYGSNAKLIFEPKGVVDADGTGTILVQADHGSILSASLTGTDTSASAEFYSPSPSSKEHPLSSATTSLSRSAKSSKEGGGLSDEKDAALSAIRLQRSLEWEARQNRQRRRSEKRRMILLELVETEVAYTEDLKTLVQVYLPQIYALPSVSERTADLIARNAQELLDIHVKLASRMVEVLKEENLGYDPQPEPVVSGQLERVSRRLAAIFVEEVGLFSAYNQYCAGSIAAATLVRHISQRTDYESYERRCQIISASQPHSSLRELLLDTTDLKITPVGSTSPPRSPTTPSGPSNRLRLHFRDFLIMPIQRICRYPLLLNQLLGAASPSPTEEREDPEFQPDEGYDVGVDVERALGAMRGVAEEADEARRIRESEIKSATILERLEPHSALSYPFLKSLGTCRLIGSLDVLHHHPIVAPLLPPVKVKYLAAFLYRGYLILAKVKKGKVYEAKHFLPLEVFELIDITEGFLPHSIRLSLRDHNFDLAASCETEKEVWASALCQARDESTVPPFELPASVSPFAARSRRMSVTMPSDSVPLGQQSVGSTSKRHTLAFPPGEGIEFPIPPERADDNLAYNVKTPATSPSRSSFSFTPDRPGRPANASTVLLRRASTTQRSLVDRSLLDVFSESCATARSKAQLHHALFLPDVPSSELRDRMAIKDSTMLRRRRSFLDSRQSSFDIAFTGEVRGSFMPIRQTRSATGKRRGGQHHPTYSHSTGKKFSLGAGNESATEVESRLAAESADETATASDFGTLIRGVGGGGSARVTAAPSSGSASRSQSPQSGPLPRRSLSNLRRAADLSDANSSLTNILALNRRKTASSYNLGRRPQSIRARSMPVSPVHSPIHEKDLPPLPPLPTMPPPADLLRRTSKSQSAQASPARSVVPLRQQGIFSLQGGETTEEPSPIYARGEGFTNQEQLPERSSNAWSTLRRSMSFISNRDRDRDRDRERDFGYSPRRPPLSRGASSMDEGDMGDMSRGTSTVALSDSLEDEDMGNGAAAGSAIGGGSGSTSGGSGELETPKRKKSVRIFQQLSRFTPM